MERRNDVFNLLVLFLLKVLSPNLTTPLFHDISHQSRAGKKEEISQWCYNPFRQLPSSFAFLYFHPLLFFQFFPHSKTENDKQ